MFPETEMEPPPRTSPTRRPIGSGRSSVFPEASNTLPEPIRTVVKSGGSEIAGKEVAPVMDIEPPGVLIEPRTVVV